MTPRALQRPVIEDGRRARASRDERKAARSSRTDQDFRREPPPHLQDDAFDQYSDMDGSRRPLSTSTSQEDVVATKPRQHQMAAAPSSPQRASGGNSPRRSSQPPRPDSYAAKGPPVNVNGNFHDDGYSHPAARGKQGHHHPYHQRDSQSSVPGSHGPKTSPPRARDSRRSQQTTAKPPGQGGGPGPAAAAAQSASSIDRLSSPTIAKSVLQPLEQKIREYSHFMDEAQSEMAHIDEQLAMLHDQRCLAEDRYLQSKSKHDEYEQQHQEVGRALRGEAPRESMMQQQPPPAAPPAMQAMPPQSPRVMARDEFHDRRPLSPQSTQSQRMGALERIKMKWFRDS